MDLMWREICCECCASFFVVLKEEFLKRTVHIYFLYCIGIKTMLYIAWEILVHPIILAVIFSL